MNKIPPITVGIDLGDLKHAICVLDAEGVVVEERTMTNHRDSFRRLAKKYPEARVALEVGMHSPWISRFLSDLGMEVLVANARKMRAIYQNTRKSDEADAKILARIGRFDPELLYPIQHVSEECQRDLLQVKLRDNLVRQRVDIISAIRFTLKSMGIRLPSPNTNCFAKRARTLLEDQPETLVLIEPSLRVLDTMKEQIRELDHAIEKLCEEKYPETKLLRNIRGVGAITALSFVLTIGDRNRFERPRDVGAFLGLVPRRLLVGSAQYLLGPFGEDCDLQRQGLKLAERGGRGAKKKAVVATARKLAVVMMTIWRDESIYQPLRKTA